MVVSSEKLVREWFSRKAGDRILVYDEDGRAIKLFGTNEGEQAQALVLEHNTRLAPEIPDSITGPSILAKRADLTFEQWIQLRTKFTGGSDTPVILGLNPWKNIYELYEEKSWPERHPSSQVTSGPAFWGTQLEPVVANVAATRIGLEVRSPSTIYCNSEYPLFLATVDFEVWEAGNLLGILEVKTTGAHMKKYWKTPAPWAYAQLNHYLAVTGTQVGWISCLIGGQDFHLWRLRRDEAMVEAAHEATKIFWEAVRLGKPSLLENIREIRADPSTFDQDD